MASVRSGRIALSVFVTYLAGAFSANIQINSGAKSVLVGLGNKQVLDCVVTGYQSQTALKFSWTYILQDNSSQVNITIEGLNNTHSFLTIYNFTEGHQGSYICTYTGDGTNKTTVTLSYVREIKTGDEYFFNNQSATLKCTIYFNDGNPGVFQEWRKDNKTVSQLEHPERFISSDNGTLTIRKPIRTDAGLYMARFNVTGDSDPYYDCEVIYRAAPLILDMEKSKNVVEDDEFDLICSIKGYPQPDVTWLKNGKTISQNNHIVFSSYGGFENAKLSVKSAMFSDEGTYACNASSFGQSSSKEIIVRVKDRLEWLWPIIGIICEAIVLGIIIFACSKVKKAQHDD